MTLWFESGRTCVVEIRSQPNTGINQTLLAYFLTRCLLVAMLGLFPWFLKVADASLLFFAFKLISLKCEGEHRFAKLDFLVCIFSQIPLGVTLV